MTIKISELGNITAVYGNTIVPVVANVGGTLTTVKGDLDQLSVYITSGTEANLLLANTNMQSYVTGQISAVNASVVTANIGVVNYINQSNSIQTIYTEGLINSANAGVTLSNITLKGYIDGQITAANAAIVANVTAANVGLKGYVDFGNTLQASAILSANVGMKGYVDNSVVTANIGMQGYTDFGNTRMLVYVDGQINAANVGRTQANLGMLGYVNSRTGGNTTISSTAPASNSSTGSAGQVAYDSNYIYICIATNTWKRANISTW